MTIYVETFIRNHPGETTHQTFGKLWERTQQPHLHQQWDARFSDIRYVPCSDESQPQRFMYETRIGFGLRISGEGETSATKHASDGSCTSALRFWSGDRKSLITQGSGYWQYVPRADGVIFRTRYDYTTRYSKAGSMFDALIFRPIMAWATAWSFDQLRLWLEEGISPAPTVIAAVRAIRNDLGNAAHQTWPSARRCTWAANERTYQHELYLRSGARR